MIGNIRVLTFLQITYYYYIGHFSKVIKPKARRIGTTTSISLIESTSFQNPDGGMVTIIMNRTEKRINYNLIVNELEVEYSIEPHSIQTLTY